jgi:hypothetical protein
VSYPALGPELQKLARKWRRRQHFHAVRSPSAQEARLNAVEALEDDPVRLHERKLDRRLAAAVFLAPRVEIAEGLLAGVPMSARRLDPAWVRVLDLVGDIVLDDELALRVNAHGPLEETNGGR